MKPLWVVRRYKGGDEYGIARLFKIEGGLGEYQWTRIWSWKHKESPVGHLTMVAEHKGQIVGHMSSIHVNMKVNKKTVIGSVVVDLLVHPSFRRQGIFRTLNENLLNEEGRKGTWILYTFANKLSHLGFRKYGWSDVSNVPNFIRFLNIYDALYEHITGKYKMIRLLSEHRVSRLLIKIVLYAASAFVGLFLRVFTRETGDFDLEDVKVKAITRFDRRIDDFWKAISKNYRIIAIRDSRCLNWLFFEKPGSKYTVLIAERGGQILGYIALQDANAESGRIVDILCFPDKPVIQLLLSKALDYFRRKNVKWVSFTMLGNNILYQVLKENAFIPLPSSFRLMVRINSQKISGSMAKNVKNWYVAMLP